MEKRFVLKVLFKKEESMLFLSQLDIFRLLIRALRRTDFALFYTSGFNPHPKISMGKALKLGERGEVEAIFYFKERVAPQEFKKNFSSQIPKDLKILDVEEADNQ